MWYLLNEYYLCLHFESEFYKYIFPHGNKYFHKFWFEILKNDAYDGEWIKYLKTEHPKFGHKVTLACLVAKLHSKIISEHKEFSTLLRCIGLQTHMVLSTHIWMFLGYPVIMLSQWQNPLIREFFLK